MSKQVQIKLKNINDVRIEKFFYNDKESIIFAGDGYTAEQNGEIRDGFYYYDDTTTRNGINDLTISNVFYKDHTYNQDDRTATLMLEEIGNGKDIQVKAQSQDRIEKHVVQDADHVTVEKYNIFTCSPSVEVDILNII